MKRSNYILSGIAVILLTIAFMIIPTGNNGIVYSESTEADVWDGTIPTPDASYDVIYSYNDHIFIQA